MKKHTAVLLLCILLAIGGFLTAGEEERSFFYGNSVESTRIRSTEQEAQDEEDDLTGRQDSDEDYIKWVEFRVTSDAMKQAYQYDQDTYGEEVHLNWVELLAVLGAKYGGDFSGYQEEDLDDIANILMKGEKTLEELTEGMKYYPYYREAYGAVLDGMVGEYEEEVTGRSRQQKNDSAAWKKVYGLKAFHPIAKGFPYSDYDDFGVSRTYGYRRNHLGHDMMG